MQIFLSSKIELVALNRGLDLFIGLRKNFIDRLTVISICSSEISMCFTLQTANCWWNQIYALSFAQVFPKLLVKFIPRYQNSMKTLSKRDVNKFRDIRSPALEWFKILFSFINNIADFCNLSCTFRMKNFPFHEWEQKKFLGIFHVREKCRENLHERENKCKHGKLEVFLVLCFLSIAYTRKTVACGKLLLAI